MRLAPERDDGATVRPGGCAPPSVEGNPTSTKVDQRAVTGGSDAAIYPPSTRLDRRRVLDLRGGGKIGLVWGGDRWDCGR